MAMVIIEFINLAIFKLIRPIISLETN